MVNKYYQKHKQKLQKKHVKDTKMFLKKKKREKRQYHRECNKNLSDEDKEKKVEYIGNYYLALKKYFFSCLWIFRVLGQFFL